MKKNILKILSLIVFIILCVSVFCINASAFSGRKKIPFSSTFAIVHNDYGTVLKTANCVKQTDGAYRIDYWLRANDFPQYYITVDGSFDTSGLIGQTVDISFEVADVFDTWTPLENYNGDNSYLQCGDWVSYPNALKTEDFTEGFSFVLKNVKITSNSTPFFMKLWFKSPDIGSLDEILTIYILQNAYVSSVDTSIKDSIDKSSSDIQANADKNANEIKANQDKNANKIINGGRDEPGYSSVDKSATNDYQAKEDEINNQTADARSSTVSFFNNFGSLLNDTPVSKGLLAVSKIMMNFFNIGWLSGLIQFALGIGAFAFILGSAIMVVGKVSSRSRSDNTKRK